MSISVEHRTQSSSVLALWSELKSYVERRSNELSEEVRNYPTPIARCDEQLTRLLEQRKHANHQLKVVTELGLVQSSNTANQWFECLAEFLASPDAVCDDEIEIAILSQLRVALLGPRDKA